MKLIATMGALMTLLFCGPAMAQVTTTMQDQMPNGNVRTTTRVETPGGTASTRTVDRADGSRTVVRRTTDAQGNARTVRHDSRDGPGVRRICKMRWDHGRRIRRCWTQRR